MQEDFHDKFITDESVAAEDWRCLFFIVLSLLIVSWLYILDFKLNEPVTTVNSYCMDNYCITLKGDK